MAPGPNGPIAELGRALDRASASRTSASGVDGGSGRPPCPARRISRCQQMLLTFRRGGTPAALGAAFR